MERALDNITVSTNGGAQTQGKLTFRRPCFSFHLLKDPLSVFFFGRQQVKYASQGRSQLARLRLVLSVCNFTEIDYNYLLLKHDGKLDFPPTLITLSWLRWTLVLSCRNSEEKFVKRYSVIYCLNLA